MIKTSSYYADFTQMLFVLDSGVSESAKLVKKETGEIGEHLANTITLGDRIIKLLEKLAAVGRKYSVDNWDGYGAKAIDSDSNENAIKFILNLPGSLPIPEIDVDPNGIVMFEWYEDKRRVFSVGIGSRGELSYAGLFGSNRALGTEYLTDYMPEVIINNINRLYSGEKSLGIS